MGRGLTDKLIASLELPVSGRRIKADAHPDAPPGFGVRVTSKGERSFYLRYRFAGRDRCFALAHWGRGDNRCGVAQARADARILRQQLEAGVDPVTVYPTLQRARAHRSTVAELAPLYLNELRARNARTRDPGYFRSEILPVIGKSRLGDVTLERVVRLVHGKRTRGHLVAAKRLFSALWAFFSWAEGLGLGRSPIKRDDYRTIWQSSPPADRRDRTLSDAEMRAFWQKVDTCGVHRGVARALKLTLVTGQLLTHVVAIQWSDIDQKDRIWRIPAGNRGKERTARRVPLSDLAFQLLVEAKQRSPRKYRGSPHVFATSRSTHLAARKLAAITDYREQLGNLGPVHWLPSDLRRTCRERLTRLGVDSETLAAVMGRGNLGVDGSDAGPHRLRAMRNALQRWATELRRIVAD